jgi:hypothetical protein
MKISISRSMHLKFGSVTLRFCYYNIIYVLFATLIFTWLLKMYYLPKDRLQRSIQYPVLF